MGVVSRFAFVALVLAPGALAFLSAPGNMHLVQKSGTRLSPAVCNVRASVEKDGFSRREILSSALSFAAALAIPSNPAFADEEYKMSGDYKTGMFRIQV